MKILKIAAGGAVVLSLVGGLVAWSAASRLSGVVSIVSKGAVIEKFLRSPETSYIESYFRFENGLADDVIFGVDQELLEGVQAPLYYKGGDWMSLVGLQRTGAVWVATGTKETMKGTPSKNRAWKILQLDKPLKAGMWYRMRCTSDFGKRHFRSIEIEGPGVKQALDLSSYTLDYPNYMPFDERAMSYYLFAMRGRSMMKTRGVPLVYFDDVEGGVFVHGKKEPVFSNGFENQRIVERQPVTLPVIKINGYQHGHFYFEREESKFRIEERPFARSGRCVGVADVDLD